VWELFGDGNGIAVLKETLGNNSILFTFCLLFPGQYFDQETGMYYNLTRDYDLATDRYIQFDSIEPTGWFKHVSLCRNLFFRFFFDDIGLADTLPACSWWLCSCRWSFASR